MTKQLGLAASHPLSADSAASRSWSTLKSNSKTPVDDLHVLIEKLGMKTGEKTSRSHSISLFVEIALKYQTLMGSNQLHNNASLVEPLALAIVEGRTQKQNRHSSPRHALSDGSGDDPQFFYATKFAVPLPCLPIPRITPPIFPLIPTQVQRYRKV